MKKFQLSLICVIAALVALPLTAIPSSGADTQTPAATDPQMPQGPDESKPIMTYCQSDMYACDGYVAASDEQYLPPFAPGFRNYQGYYRNDLARLYRFGSFAINIVRDSSGQAKSVTACKDIAGPDCSGPEIIYSADLPMCTAGTTIDCLRDIVITDAENKPLSYTIDGEFPKGNPQNFIGSPSMKVPNGASPTLIHIPGAPHKGGDAYLVKAEMTANKRDGHTEFFVESFFVTFTAVKIVDGKYSFGGVSTNPALYTKGFGTIGSEKGTYPSKCAAASDTQCAERYALPLGIHYGVTVDLSQKITGWLHGRMRAPQVDVSTNQAGGSTIKILAEAIKIPINAAWVNNDSAAQSIKDFYAGKPNYGSPLFGNENKTKPLSEISLLRDGNSGHNQETLNEYLAWLATLGDKAQAMPTAWVVQTMTNYDVAEQLRICLRQTDSLAGIVTSNAAEYLDGPPVYDKAAGSLDYKVAATHFEPDGTTVFKGSYDLVMSSKVARCIYGFTQAPISATVSVTSEAGTPSVATTVVNEKNGWLSLGAYNFTYSTPTIRVKLTQAPVKAESVAAPTKVATKTITCVKGKVKKSITGSNPKCPIGYKKS